MRSRRMRLQQTVEQRQPLELGDAPRRCVLAADTVDRREIALQHGHLDASARQHGGQSRSGNATADDDDVVRPLHSVSRQRAPMRRRARADVARG